MGTIAVYRGGERTGTIQGKPGTGFYFRPWVRNPVNGERFQTLAEVKASLEAAQ